MKRVLTATLLSGVLLGLVACHPQPAKYADPIREDVLYTYTLSATPDSAGYDEAVAVACIQGILNRERPCVYVLHPRNGIAAHWLDTFSAEDGWLADREQVALADFDALMRLGLNKVKGLVIWDPAVPASLNVATTLSGIKDAVVVTPAQAESFRAAYGLKVIKDFRGMFTGAETGSAKNDAYRWAIREYLQKGLCSSQRLSLYHDAWQARETGDIGYVVTRDWAVAGRTFVYDLSPWDDDLPKDDPGQRMGLDTETYRMMLEAVLEQSAGDHMTEVAGFFQFRKYSNMPPDYPAKHDPVPTEWKTVHIISQYNCYQNTVASDCYNQSVHSHAPQPCMKQGRPERGGQPQPGKTYLAILMADYDSATPLYDFFVSRHIWDDPRRGEIPLLWGINPNLCETFPDIMQYLYETRTPNDWFAGDASCAGYFNPSRIREEYLPLFVRHNKKFYDQWDMTISPMVLDTAPPSDAVKDAFMQFSPDGYATIVSRSGFEPDPHDTGAQEPDDHVWKGMPVTRLLNDACNFHSVEEEAQIMSRDIPAADPDKPGFYLFRIVWTRPGLVIDSIERLKQIRPDLDIEVLDAYNFFDYLKKSLE